MSPRFTFAITIFAALSLPLLAHAHPGHGEAPLVAQAGNTPAKPLDNGPFFKVAPRESDLSKRTLYVVGYAHLDTQWRWAYPQVIREFIPNTMQRNFTLFEKYPNYVFNFSGSRRYQMMQEYYPADYARVKAYVKAGRWFPCGSSVDEGDSVVPSLESMVRHTLYGNQFFKREFNTESREFMLPDCFGFPAALPTILAHCGISGFSTQKLTWGSANGIPFKVGNWIGPDGNAVVSALDPGSYTGNVSEDLSRSSYWRDRINDNGAKSGVFADYHYYGTGDVGGAPADDAVRWVEESVKGDGQVRIESASAEKMFRDITPQQRTKLPNYKGELLLTEHSAGSITSQAYMKRWNRKNELLADSAERASVAAMTLGAAYPTRKLYDAWQLVLGSQMHDILPGTSLPRAYQYSWNDELLALNSFANVAQDGVAAVSDALDTRAQGVPVVVYNPLSQAREDIVQANVKFPGVAPRFVRIVGPHGENVKSQVLARRGQTLTILFPARVGPVGFATYDVQPANSDILYRYSELHVSQNSLENARFRVQLNGAGDVSSVFDKRFKREVLQAPVRLAFQSEHPSQFPAWNMDWNDRKNPPRGYVGGPAQVRVLENGPVRVAIQVTRQSEGSTFRQTVRLSLKGEQVEFPTQIDWQSRECSLKAVFPLRAGNPNANYDGQIGVLTRGNNEPRKYEVPQHQWCDLTARDNSYGATILNDSKYGSDKPDDNTLRLTLLYTPDARSEYQDQASQDTGRHDMFYALAPHGGDWRKSGATWKAARVNQPLIAFQTVPHAGTLGRSFSLLRLNSPNVNVAAIKKAENSNEIIVRLEEITGQPQKSVRLATATPVVSMREVDGQERPIGTDHPLGVAAPLPAQLQNGALSFGMQPFGLRAFALKLGAPKARTTPIASVPVALAFDGDAVSKDSNRKNGKFDAQGRTFPAEQLPSQLTSEGVTFQFGSTRDNAKNVLTCRGQTLRLPAGFNRVYLLAASDGDASGMVKLGARSQAMSVQDWTGFVGQWDTRLWGGPEPEMSFDWSLPLVGLMPGYVKRDNVAWFASHRHHPTIGNEFYQYSYLFKYGFDLNGARTLTLPNNPRVRVFAVSVARNTHDQTRAAQPLYDTLADHIMDAPQISVPGVFSDAVPVSLSRGLYGSDGDLRYTLDGSTPTIASPAYNGELYVSRDTVLKVRSFDAQKRGSAIATRVLQVRDVTPPKVLLAQVQPGSSDVRVAFSEPVDAATATDTSNYALDGAKVQRAILNADNRTVTLQLTDPVAFSRSVAPPVATLQAKAKDRSARGNTQVLRVPVSVLRPVYELAPAQTLAGKGDGFSARSNALPISGDAPWTISMWVYADKQPDDLTLLGGFGSGDDSGGAQRYLIKLNNSLHFWGSSIDISAGTPLDVGKWQHVAATYNGKLVRLYKNGRELKSASASFVATDNVVKLGPPSPWRERSDSPGGQFSGRIANFQVWNDALSTDALTALAKQTPQ